MNDGANHSNKSCLNRPLSGFRTAIGAARAA